MQARGILALISAALVCAAVACGPQRIDTSSDDAFLETVERMRQSLPDEQRNDFEEALTLIKLEGLTTEEFIAAGGPATAGDPSARLRRAITGKTAEEILVMAAELRRERVRLLAQELEKRQQANQQLHNALDQFDVQWAYFKWERTRGRVVRKIELQVLNATGHDVSAIRYNASLTSPDRTEPWGRDDDFYYSPPGGIAAGERTQFDIFIPDTSGLAVDTDRIPIDVDLQFEVTALYGPGNEPLIDLASAPFSPADAAALATLEAELSS